MGIISSWRMIVEKGIPEERKLPPPPYRPPHQRRSSSWNAKTRHGGMGLRGGVGESTDEGDDDDDDGDDSAGNEP